MSDVVQKLWGFCHTLRHDGIDYGDYIEQITYLLFLKMADERGVELPEGLRLADAPRQRSGTDLIDHYIDVLRTLGKPPGILGDIYAGAQSRFNNPVNLKKLINLIDETEWTSPRRRREGRRLRGAAREGRERGQEGRRPVLHAARPDPVDRPLHEARPARAPGLHDLRPGLRHRRLPRRRLRVARRRDQGRASTATSPSASRPRPTSARTSSPARAAWP